MFTIEMHTTVKYTQIEDLSVSLMTLFDFAAYIVTYIPAIANTRGLTYLSNQSKNLSNFFELRSDFEQILEND